MAKKGRPSKYSKALAERICAGIAQGKSLVAVLKGSGMPTYNTVLRWLADERYADFRGMYARAREMQADYLADQIVDIADTATGKDDAQAVKVRCDARKWVASKLRPRKYGDRLGIEGADGGPVRQSIEVRFVEAGEDE
jgi:hypothetical protein